MSGDDYLMTEFQVKYSSNDLKLAAISMARESCRTITEARKLRDVYRKADIIKAAVKKMDEATLLRGKASLLENKESGTIR